MRGMRIWGFVTILSILIIFCFSNTAQASSNLLRLGSRGEEVKKLQQSLIQKGFLEGKADGIFGPNTENGVIQFQKAKGIKQDGIAGPITLNLLYEEDSKETKSEESISEENENNSEQTEADRGSKNEEVVNAIIDFAIQYLGKPYVYSASGPDAFDCSGFTCYVYSSFGISLPRSAKDQGYGDYAPRIEREDLQPGDLVFFNTNSKDGDLSDHAGIYIGDGEFIHASSSSKNGRKVVISPLDSGYYERVFSWGRRVLK